MTDKERKLEERTGANCLTVQMLKSIERKRERKWTQCLNSKLNDYQWDEKV